MRVLRRIEGVSRLDRVRNVDLRGMQIEARVSVGYSEEAAAELEAKGGGDEYQQSD